VAFYISDKLLRIPYSSLSSSSLIMATLMVIERLSYICNLKHDSNDITFADIAISDIAYVNALLG
jgi:hypothetical protein